jgi:hypothetical protein
MIENIQYWWLTDPKAKLKVIVLLIIVSIVTGLFYLVIVSRSSKASIVADQSSQSESSQANPIIPFGDNSGIELIDSQAVQDDYKIFFDVQDQTLYRDQNNNLRYNKQTYTEVPDVFPFSVYNSKDNLIINELVGTRLFLVKSRQTIQLPSNVLTVTPKRISTLTIYYSIQENDGKVELMEGRDVGAISNSQPLADLGPKQDRYEIKIIRNQIYVFRYKQSGFTNNLEILRYNSITQKMDRLYSLPQTISIVYSDTAILINQLINNSEQAINTVIDFNSSDQGQRYLINIDEQLKEKNILGQTIVRRCQIDGRSRSLYCLIKSEDVIPLDYSVEDKIVKVNYTDNSITILYDSLMINGHTLTLDSQGYLYIVANPDQRLYKFTDKP